MFLSALFKNIGVSMYARMLTSVTCCLFVFLNFSCLTSYAGDANDFTFSTTTYLNYETQIKQVDGLQGGSFNVARSYITLKKNIMGNLSFRVTVDAYSIPDGSWSARLKYVYGEFKFDDIAFISKPNIEFGMAHTPWLDFEEHINYYRMQGTMFMERNDLFNSADLGITIGGLLGGEMSQEYKDNVNSKYAGRYGSFAMGLYNGGGYHAKENVDNKVFEGRLTYRPLPEVIPGLQISYFGVFGKGNMNYTTNEANDDSIPDWKTNAIMLSYENEYLTCTGQYVNGMGNQKGNLYNLIDGTLKLNGYSLFAEGKIDHNWKVIGRYDTFDNNLDIDDNEIQRYIVGVAYDFGHHNMIILDFDKRVKMNEADNNLLKLTMQIEF